MRVIVLGSVAAFFMFADVWWISVIALVLAGLVVGILDRENTRLHDALAQHESEPQPDRAPRSGPKPQAGDAFLRELRQLGKRK
jgi:hypothetical protein